VRSETLRTPARARQMPRVLRQATVAIEDRRFFEHEGVDERGIARAAWRNLWRGEAAEGASTLTMQLVRALYLNRDQTLERKVAEAKLASELERERSKRWILTTYLNNASYGTRDGQELVGVHAASHMWFGKGPRRLNLRQAALLAGLPQAPTRLNPVTHPEAAAARRNEVLRAMARDGYVSHERAQRVSQRGLALAPRSELYDRYEEPFFFDHVRRELVERYGADVVERGGLRVHTTIDRQAQRRARAAMTSVLNQPGDPHSAIVTVRPRTGNVQAMASTRSYDRSAFSLAAQARRQPGSAFKPMALVAALRRNVDPWRTAYPSRPIDRMTRRHGKIETKTYDDTYAGRRVSLEEGMLRSDNTVYMRLTLDIGPRAVVDAARRMGIQTPLNPYPSVTLGGLDEGVTPMEMAAAYGTLANDGVRARPRAIRRVEFPDGRVDRWKPRAKRTLTRRTARAMTEILAENVTSGTGGRARIGCPVAGKTGTTDSYKDAWFAGYTRGLSTAVWVGYSTPRPMRNVHGIRVAGGTFPAEIWGRYMRTMVDACRPLRRLAGAQRRLLKPACDGRTTTRQRACRGASRRAN
jgi:penicillin-binding protein 1A